MIRKLLAIAVLGTTVARATPLEVGGMTGGTPWLLPGDKVGYFLKQGSSSLQRIDVPSLSAKEKSVPGEWRGIVSVDGFGTGTEGDGVVVVELLEPLSGEVLARGDSVVRGKAPRAWWAVVASSEHEGSAASQAFDGDAETGWHSKYGDDAGKAPHWVGIEFGSAREIQGVSYLPGSQGYGNGIPKEYRVEIRKPNGAWEIAASGTSDQEVVFNQRKEMRVLFSQPLAVEAFRLVIVSDWTGGGFGSAAEVSPIGLDLPEKERTGSAETRIWLEIPPKLLTALEGKSFAVRVSADSGSAVIGTARFCRVHSAPTERLLGKSNGGTGPDKLGAGLLGFDALTEHLQAVLTVMKVREGSPAAKAGLVAGDAIVTVAGKALGTNDLKPGWEWFERSHETTFGRASEAALAAREKFLDIGVLRSGKVETLTVELNRQQAFTTMNPTNDAEAAALLADLLAWVETNQQPDGSWSGDIKRTTFAALALLATGDKRHEMAVKRAVDWSMNEFPNPDRYGRLGFWAGSYAGILYAEWHLLTGDKRVLPHMKALSQWTMGGKLTSKWGIPAIGHGPSELPYENKALVAPACHLFVYEALAMRCGIKSEIWEMLMPYMEMSWSDPNKGGHGSLGYNPSLKDKEQFWSRSGLFALSCALRGERKEMQDAMTGFMPGRHPWLRNSHAYGEPGGALGLLGLNVAAPEAYAKVIRQYGWWFSLAWEPGYGLRFTTPHMGAPYMGEDDLIIPAYALILQGPKRTLHVTGKK